MYYFQVLITVAFFGSALGRCAGNTFDTFTNKSVCYEIEGARIGSGIFRSSYLSAETECVKLGGHLASIPSGMEQMYLAEAIHKELIWTEAKLWIGLNDIDSKGTWTWIDKASSTFTNWGAQQPSNETGHDCAVFDLNSGEWSTKNCSEKTLFLCTVPNKEE